MECRHDANPEIDGDINRNILRNIEIFILLELAGNQGKRAEAKRCCW